MCLVISDEYHDVVYVPRGNNEVVAHKPKPLIAGYPILCFKILRNPGQTGGYAPYIGCRWTFGKMRTSRMTRDDRTLPDIDQGLHAMQFEDTAKRKARGWMDRVGVFAAIIPTGAEFYIGRHGDLVANKMIVYRSQDEAVAAHGGEFCILGNVSLHKKKV